jgi:hypothetical protein
VSPPLAEEPCPDEDSPGKGCFPLRVLTRKVDGAIAAQREQAEKEGHYFAETKACRIASEKAQAAAEDTRDYAKAAVQAVNAPINDLLRNYQKRVSESDPPESPDKLDLGGFDMSDVTRKDIISPSNTIRRIRQAEKDFKQAEEARIKLEAEKLVAERYARELLDEKDRSDRNYKTWIAVLGSVAALATMGAGALALASKFFH